MTEELTGGKNEEGLDKAKSKNEDFEMTEWHADEEFVYDQYNNMVCECYHLGYVDQEYGIAWARRNASEIAFLHNDQYGLDKSISQAKQQDISLFWEGIKQTRKEKDEQG